MKMFVSPSSKTIQQFPPELLTEIDRHLINLSDLLFLSELDLKNALVSYHSLVGVLSMVNLKELVQKARIEEDAVTGIWGEKDHTKLQLRRNDFVAEIRAFFHEPMTGPQKKNLEDILSPYGNFLEELAILQNKKIHPLVIKTERLSLPAEYQGEFLTIFIHLAKNAIDHGIEKPQERIQAGKDEAGTIIISERMSIKDQEVEIRFSDDGSGIDPKILQHIFDFGFSTRVAPSDLSGKGVGLHSVKNIVDSLGGKIRVESLQGKGATFILQLPFLK